MSEQQAQRVVNNCCCSTDLAVEDLNLIELHGEPYDFITIVIHIVVYYRACVSGLE